MHPTESVAASLDDLLCDEAVNRPSAFFARLHAHDPVYWNARWNGWVVTGYDDVVAGFRDSARLSSDRFAGPFGRDMVETRSAYAELIDFMSKWMFSNDPPFHTHLRTLVNTAFTPSSVELLRPRVRQLVPELVEPLRGRDRVNFLAEFAFTLPVIVIAEYLGLPAEARQLVREWSDQLGAVIFVQGNNKDRFVEGERAMHGLVDLIRPVVRARRAEPRDDLISAMVHAEVDGDRFTEDEVIANAVLMVFAGHETTMNLLANGIVAFDAAPEQWQSVRRDARASRMAVEEVLRFDGPIKALARWAREPLKIGGQQVQTNDRVLLVQHAANHDPVVFASPEQFDVSRWPNKHVGFGQGIHTCLGAPLARLEAQEAYSYLAEAFSSVEVLTSNLRYDPNLVSRALQGLEVRLHER